MAKNQHYTGSLVPVCSFQGRTLLSLLKNKQMIFFKTKKQKEKIVIQNYLKKLKDVNLTNSIYYQSKTHLISILEWLLAYYEGKAGCSPKIYLEAMLRDTNHNKLNQEQIKLLYFWIYKKEIVGF